jgi:S-formylglutathione hydrolase FrmB
MMKYLAVLVSAAIVLAAARPAAHGAAPTGNVWKKYIVQSPSTGKIERFWVGHPASIKAGPAANPDARGYPVIYFLPGLLDGDDTWKGALDPHLAKYELIAVCPAVGGATWYMNSPAQPWMKWGDYLTEDLRGFIESQYPAAREKGQRGIAGISAGAQAFYHAVMRPDLYGSVSVLSGACDLRGYAGAVGLDYWIGPKSPETLPLYAERSCIVLAGRLQGPPPFDLFLDAGDKDGALPQMEALRKVLDAKGAPYRWFPGKGVHDWSYWTARAGDHVAWHAEQFARNRREGRFAEKAPAKGAPLALVASLPDVALGLEAERRLKAPWAASAGARPEVVTGLPKEGGPLSKTDARFKEVKLAAVLDAHGHAPGLFVSRLTLRVGTPVPREGTVALRLSLRNGRGQEMIAIPAALAVPAGQPDRRADLRARLVIELKGPDPLRGGIVAGLQVFDGEGSPAGAPAVGKALPGSLEVERWPVAPRTDSQWVLSLAGEKGLPVAAVYEARLEAEP